MNAVTPVKAAEIMEAVITKGDIANLSAEQRAKYYIRVCESIGLNPMTRPFEYITLNGKLVLYARKDCTDQLRSLHNISVTELIESERDGVFIVTAKVTNGTRSDAAKGAVHIQGLKGEALANAMMKAETKAKRRATLSICGLGFLDETEVEDLPPERNGARDDGPPAPPTRTAAIAHRPQTENPAPPTAPTDDIRDMPEGLRREAPGFDEAQWLRDLDGALAGCEDFASVGEVQRDVMMPEKKRASPAGWKKAEKLVAAALDRINTVLAAG